MSIHIDEPVIKNPIMNAIEEYQLEGAEKRSREIVIRLMNNFPDLSDDKLAEMVGENLLFVKKVKQGPKS